MRQVFSPVKKRSFVELKFWQLNKHAENIKASQTYSFTMYDHLVRTDCFETKGRGGERKGKATRDQAGGTPKRHTHPYTHIQSIRDGPANIFLAREGLRQTETGNEHMCERDHIRESEREFVCVFLLAMALLKETEWEFEPKLEVGGRKATYFLPFEHFWYYCRSRKNYPQTCVREREGF